MTTNDEKKGSESQPAKNEEELPPITAEEADHLTDLFAQFREAMKPFLNK